MRHAILELGKIEVELRAASKAPKEVGIDGGEMVEEPFAISEPVVRDLVILEQLLLGEPSDGLLRAGEVADARGRIDARKKGMEARRAPGQKRDRIQFLQRAPATHLPPPKFPP